MSNKKNEIAFSDIVKHLKTVSRIPLGIQISHSGRKGSVTFPWNGNRPLTSKEGSWQTFAPSKIPKTKESNVPAELDLQQINSIKDDFIAAAIRAERAGIDVLEIHVAHGYLLHQFFSPISNKRTDEYGGNLNNRMRLILEIAEGIRTVIAGL